MNVPYYPLITGNFLDKEGRVITFQIYRTDVTSAPASGSDFAAWGTADWRVPGEEPIIIEWDSSKRDTIIGSTCTIQLVSPYDGALLPLYTSQPGLYCCKITRSTWGGGQVNDVWFGWLDTEFYEEPFTDIKDYEVTLTFSDFALLKRKIFNSSDLGDMATIESIVNAARDICFPESTPTSVTTNISTVTPAGASVLTGLNVRTSNFTDENGETMTWYDVLESVLKPLALRIEQRKSTVHLYDMNALAILYAPLPDEAYDRIHLLQVWQGNVSDWESAQYRVGVFETLDEAEEYFNEHYDGTYRHGNITIMRKDFSDIYSDENYIEPVAVDWCSTDQTLAVDETFNKVKITFSPYADTTLFDGDKIDFETNLDLGTVKNGYGYESTEEYDSFQIRLQTLPNNNLPDGIAYSGKPLFKITALQGGDDCKGVVGYIGGIENGHIYKGNFIDGDGVYNYNDQYDYRGVIPKTIRDSIVEGGFYGNTLYKTKRIWIPNALGTPSMENRRLVMKLQIPMLYDGRYNPFEQADNSHNILYDRIKQYANTIGLHIKIRLYAAKTGGSPLLYYHNYAFEDAMYTIDNQRKLNDYSPWRTEIPGTDSKIPAFIMYNKFDGARVDEEDCPCLGGMQDGGVPFNNKNTTTYAFRKNNDGLYIPFPKVDSGPAGYWMEIEVTDGLYIYDGRKMIVNGDSNSAIWEKCTKNSIGANDHRAYSDSRWWLVGFPTVTVVQNDHQIFEDAEVEDIEQSGVVDPYAANELSIDTICGCAENPTARGAFFNSATGAPVATLSRGARSDTAEQLLIGTICSQYAERHMKLSGTIKSVVPVGGLQLLTDTHYLNKRFLVTSEVYNVIEGESEITMVEVSPDNYTSV